MRALVVQRKTIHENRQNSSKEEKDLHQFVNVQHLVRAANTHNMSKYCEQTCCNDEKTFPLGKTCKYRNVYVFS